MKKIIIFLLLSVSIFGKLNLKVIYSDPADTEITIERAKKIHSESGIVPLQESTTTETKVETKTENIPNQKIENVVYVTKSGKKYHRESCRYNKNTTAMSVGEAIELGLGACGVCKP